LLTESQVFKDEVLPGPESTDHPPKEMPERHDHGKNLIGKVGIAPCAKSFILWAYDVLARYRHILAGQVAAGLAHSTIPNHGLTIIASLTASQN
jgi:hypothetical protein